MKSEFKPEKLPAHIAFIMDGNGRWAKKRLMPRSYGHRAGVDTLKKLASDVFALGIRYMTVYAFSTENRERPAEEIEGLIDLIRTRMEDMTAAVIEGGVRVVFMGELSFFPDDVREILSRVEQKSAGGERGVLNVALNYGSRHEIARAAALAAKGGEITPETIKANLYTPFMPDPDMIVRTGGEMRLSNFMLYQAAYAELFFTDTLWPDFGKRELCEILEEYGRRNRRFGRVK